MIQEDKNLLFIPSLGSWVFTKKVEKDKKLVPNVLLLTGGCGFVGSHLVEGALKQTDWNIVVLDCLTYAGNLNRLADISIWEKEKNRVKFVWHDLRAPISETVSKMIGKVDIIWHLAAESHVERSLQDAIPFALSNVVGTTHLLEWIKKENPQAKTIVFSCYDRKTRALTKDGLKTYEELKEGDIVFTINPKTKELEEQPVEKVIVQDYSGKMIKFNNKIIDLLTTPNHRIYDKEMKVLEAKECLGKNIKFPIPLRFKGKKDDILIGGKKKPLKDLFYLIGVFLGDGFTAYQEKKTKSKSGLTKPERDKIRDKKTGRFVKTGKIGNNDYVIEKSWRIFFDIPENDKARLKTEKTLKNLGIKFTKQKGKAGEHLYFTSEEWLKFFNQFGKGAKNKFIPKWILEYDAVYLKELFNGLIDSDGYWGTRVYSTVSDNLADNICELAIKIGYFPNKQKRYSEVCFENRIIKGYVWHINFGEKGKSINPQFIKEEDYTGKIWCITVKNKNFLVERNGKFAFSGNTDEVFGAAPKGKYFKEDENFKPSNPYSASKAGEEMMAYAFAHSFKLPIFIVRSMNIFGERQDPEKFIPKTVRAILKGEKVVIHGLPGNISSRCWIHAREVCNAMLFLTEKGEPEQFYHIVGEERNVLELAQKIAKIIRGKELMYDLKEGLGEINFIDFHQTRPGHDLRYALDGTKLKEMGFQYTMTLDKSIEKMVQWMIKKENQKWLNL